MFDEVRCAAFNYTCVSLDVMDYGLSYGIALQISFNSATLHHLGGGGCCYYSYNDDGC